MKVVKGKEADNENKNCIKQTKEVIILPLRHPTRYICKRMISLTEIFWKRAEFIRALLQIL